MIEPIIYRGQSAEELFGKREELTSQVEDKVREIINNVRANGDKALKEYCKKFDGFTATKLEVEESEFDEALNSLTPEYIATLKGAIANIEEFHKKQKRQGFKIERGGAIIGQKVIPVECAGIYVPGGTAAYPSTVLMNAIPAKIAGVKNVVMVTPVKADGKVKAEVLASAKLCGVDRVFKIGGAQAIAALAYGTESVPKADKITGPGNAYVATAKKLVAGVACGIDMLAGPSEILVLADGGANARHVSADLLSQAEHDVLASALFITDSITLAKSVIAEIYRQAEKLKRRDIALSSIENNCKVIVVDNLNEGVKLANEYSPEHLELCVKDPFHLLDNVKNAGSVFLGYNTPEAVGDYYAGANHTLPTSGTARFSSPLGVDDFVKYTQYIYYTKEELEKVSENIQLFAKSEGLTGHAESVAVRFKDE
jgi:histidinol dehydrogenase